MNNGPGLLLGRWLSDPLGSDRYIVISTRRFCGSRTPSAVGTRGFSLPYQLVSIAAAGTPSRTRAALTVSARRLESARLYFCVPTRSVYPAIATFDLPLLNAAAAASTTLRPSAVSDDLSNSKKTMNTCFCGATTAGGGGGGATTGGAGGGVILK